MYLLSEIGDLLWSSNVTDLLVCTLFCAAQIPLAELQQPRVYLHIFGCISRGSYRLQYMHTHARYSFILPAIFTSEYIIAHTGLALTLLFIAGSCVDAGFTDCCNTSCDITSDNSICFCDQQCFSLNDCCFDILDVPCFPG